MLTVVVKTIEISKQKDWGQQSFFSVNIVCEVHKAYSGRLCYTPCLRLNYYVFKKVEPRFFKYKTLHIFLYFPDALNYILDKL